MGAIKNNLPKILEFQTDIFTVIGLQNRGSTFVRYIKFGDRRVSTRPNVSHFGAGLFDGKTI